jgi:hypothetical protein
LAGKIKQAIDQIISERSKGNPTIATITKTKLVLKGIDPNRYSLTSEDDPAVIAKLKALAAELGISLSNL